MTTAPGTDWRSELGIEDRSPPQFFADKKDIDQTGRLVPQAHALRRAFDGMDLNGILFLQNSPAVYFKEVDRIEPEEVRRLHRRFWNQGLAPVLVIIDPREVHIYSGLVTPPREGEPVDSSHRLVTTLNRTSEVIELRQLILALESGEFFHAHAKSFDPNRRVDRELLKNLEAAREEMALVSGPTIEPRILDALLCRVVFTCYLFDRKIIEPEYLREAGIEGAKELRELLGWPEEEAKSLLYALFRKLGEDFNGDLFNVDLDSERNLISRPHLTILDRFLRGADVRTGQGSFWPYDFSIIPIETISSIYEHFLKYGDPARKKESGAFYTPRFLAEILIDMGLEGFETLLDKRFLDPACGSGIFLVGLFNRLAEEWQRKYPDAPYEEQASGLMAILRENLYGVDENPTACRIAAFSLYLALLDQLKPSDIRELRQKQKVLPPLVFDPIEEGSVREGKTIIRADFFTEEAGAPIEAFHLVIGNPPWASLSGPEVPAERWCKERELPPLPNRQLALAFVWKAPEHIAGEGRVCFVLPHGVLFNHHEKAIEYQREWLKRHRVDLILNLADYQRFLFEAEAPAVVARYLKEPPSSTGERIRYLAPKTDWSVSQAGIISVLPEDTNYIRLREVLASLRGDDRVVVWKERFWGTPRDAKLLDRLSLFPPLRTIARQPREKTPKRWAVAQGFKPEMDEAVGPKSKPCPWPPTQLFLDANSRAIDLFIVETDCAPIDDQFPWLHRLPEASEIFEAPHVLVTQGMRVAYADFDVVFRHAVQGYHGPAEDRELLIFLAAYLRSPLARYYLFHRSSNWGVSRSKVHLAELQKLPFPLPEQTLNPERGREIVHRIAERVQAAAELVGEPLVDRRGIVETVQREANDLIYDYFDVDEVERVLVEDTNSVIIPSTRPSRASDDIPTLKGSTAPRRDEYKDLLCETLNEWAREGPYRVSGHVRVAPESGFGLVILDRFTAGHSASSRADDDTTGDLISTLYRLQKAFKKQFSRIETIRGVKVFDPSTLYLIKPLNQRFWTKTAALNDADDIAATVLMQPIEETP